MAGRLRRATEALALRIAARAAPYWLLGVAVCSLGALAAYHRAEQAGVRELRRVNTVRVAYFARSLETSLERHESLPYMLAVQRDVVEFLGTGGNEGRNAMNRYLRDLQQQARVAVVYLLDPTGRTVAASNFDLPSSFVDHNYGFRPYFTSAMAGDVGRFYAVGVTTQAPGYFLSYPVRERGSTVGVATVKVSLDEDEAAWVRSGECLVLVDDKGIVFLSSVPGWKYKSLQPLSATTLRELAVTRQYYTSDPQPLLPPHAVPDGGRIERVRLPVADGVQGSRDFLVQARSAGRLQWQVLLFSDLAPVKRDAALISAATAFGLALVWLVAFVGAQRARRGAERASARLELTRMHETLEARIAERTAALVQTNAALQERVREHAQAERILRDTRDEVVQAGKLAVLGQMAAGMTHELNQPLAALRTLSDNAVTLLERGRDAEARDNLALIGELTARMGNIVAQLKAFARKRPTASDPVKIVPAIQRAWQLVTTRYRRPPARLCFEPAPADACVLGDAVRLEQVLVNVFNNAIDAVGGDANATVEVRVEVESPVARIHVRDNGPGLSSEAIDRLFEPFFTTKPVGEGLGLGLTISNLIVEASGGTLRARNDPAGGAWITIELKAAACPAARQP